MHTVAKDFESWPLPVDKESPKPKAKRSRLGWAWLILKTVFLAIFVWPMKPFNEPLNRFERRHRKALSRLSFAMNTLVFVLIVLALCVYVYNKAYAALDDIRGSSGYSWETYRDIIVSAVIAPNVSKPMTKSQRELAYNLVGLTFEEREFFDKVAKCESSWKPNAVGLNKDKDGKVLSADEGFLQINSWWAPYYENSKYRGEVYAVIPNLRMAKFIFETEGADQWTCARTLGLADSN